MYPQRHWSMPLTVVSSGSQLLLSNSLLFYFKSKKEFILKICKVRHLKKKCASWKVKLFCLTGLFFTQYVLNARLWIENHWWNVRISSFWKQNKSRYFGLQTLKAWNWDVQPLKCYSVKVFGVHRSNVPQLSALKQFLICLEKAHKRSFTSHRICSKRPKR